MQNPWLIAAYEPIDEPQEPPMWLGIGLLVTVLPGMVGIISGILSVIRWVMA